MTEKTGFLDTDIRSPAGPTPPTIATPLNPAFQHLGLNYTYIQKEYNDFTSNPQPKHERRRRIIQGIKARIQDLTESYHNEQYAYLVKQIRYTEVKRHPTRAPATGLYSLQWWENDMLQCCRNMQELVLDMRELERERKARVLEKEEVRIATAVRRIERARRERRERQETYWRHGGGFG